MIYLPEYYKSAYISFTVNDCLKQIKAQASKMFVFTATIFATSIFCALASQIEIPGKPVLISPCTAAVLKKCPKLPPYMYCAKFYTPDGECCPVCACKDNHGRSFLEGSTFLINEESSCKQCTCRKKNNVLSARCVKLYCGETLKCPPSYQVKVPGSCCKRCRSDWSAPIRTFPPFPGGGFPRPGGGFPRPGGGFPQPGGGFPQPGGGFPQPGGGFPQPGGGFPRPGGGFPQPGKREPFPAAGDEVASPFGDEKAVENIAGESHVKRKKE